MYTIKVVFPKHPKHVVVSLVGVNWRADMYDWLGHLELLCGTGHMCGVVSAAVKIARWGANRSLIFAQTSSDL